MEKFYQKSLNEIQFSLSSLSIKKLEDFSNPMIG